MDLYERFYASIGVGPTDVMLICDYGTSPVSFTASSMFCPLGMDGLSERLGFRVLCNDGIPEFSRRTVHMIETVKPDVVLIRHDLVPPLLNHMRWKKDQVRAFVITANDRAAMVEHGLARGLGVPASRFLRDDLALFAMLECRTTPGFHVPTDFYLAEIVDPKTSEPLDRGGRGRLAVTGLSKTSVPVVRYMTSYEGHVDTISCGCGFGPDPSTVFFVGGYGVAGRG